MRLLRLLLLLLFFISPSILKAQKIGQSIPELETLISKHEKDGNTLELARCQTKLGFLYKDKNDIQKSIDYFQKALKSNEILGNLNAIKNLSVNLGMTYSEIDNYEQALIYFKKSLKINESLNKTADIVADLLNIAQTLQNLKSYAESNQNLEKAASLAQEVSDMISLKNCYATLSENYDRMGDQAKAKEYFELAASIKGHLQKKEIEKFETRTQQAESEVSVKNIEIQTKDSKIKKLSREQQLTLELLNQQKELNELKDKEFQAKEKLQKARQHNTYLIIASLVVILFLVTVSLLFIFKQLREKKKAYCLLEQSNHQITEQKKEIEKQRDIATAQKKKITDSIYYAKRIQSAVLPPMSILDRILPENFVIYNPKDIVSGDFYWIVEKEGILIIAAADCTGKTKDTGRILKASREK